MTSGRGRGRERWSGEWCWLACVLALLLSDTLTHMHLAATVEEGEEWDGEERRDFKACGIKSRNALLESLPLRLFYTLSVRWPAETRTRLFAQPAKVRALPTTNQNDNDYSRTRFIITILTQNILFFIQAFQRNVTHAHHLYLGKTV